MNQTRTSEELFLEIYEWLENQVDAAMATGDAPRAILFATYMRNIETAGLVKVPEVAAIH